MTTIFSSIEKKLIKRDLKKIVFPEAFDSRVLKAVSKLNETKSIQPIMIGNEEDILKKAKELSIDLSNCTIINPHKFEHIEDMLLVFLKKRKGKINKDEAKVKLLDVNYFGTLLVEMGLADGLVSGAVHATADVLRPALQIIKPKERIRKVSSSFLMMRNSETYIFADCAINIAPSSEDLAEIAIESATTASLFGIDPKIAMLSFSTKGSATSEETTKVSEAVNLVKKCKPNITIDGELQFDTAYVPEVAEKKAPNSVIKGNANIFIFPSLEAGNIGYKLAERLGGYQSIGPILQGLNKPINDLSRGCSVDDVYHLALITALQADNSIRQITYI